ncbi:DUF6603 domain-containing protein [Arachidicoccus terrestris]|uniref:DUF6603 domain-containing protein n=1 Tax=Arachidicoccus terrestris TaxID=2875539 RepID=UPI001CC4E976|nr:DUF6603 domain-containing protein [Arachidicoccus terrestris]UAY54339.1 hypothetical protein K9M52_12855 [Arachidicoccus terrestris]
MALTFDKLKELLTPDNQKQISLPADKLETPTLTALWQLAFFASAGTLNISQASMSADDKLQLIIIKGEVSKNVLTGVEKGQLTEGKFIFNTADNTVSAKLSISIADPSWSLAMMFPILSGPLVDSITLAMPSIIIDTDSTAQLPADFRSSFGYPPEIKPVADSLVSGLSFAATVNIKGEQQSLIGAVINLPVAMSGPISLWHFKGDNYMPEAIYPELLLEMAVGGKSYSYGENKFSFTMQMAVLFQEIVADTPLAFAVTPLTVLAIRSIFSAKGWKEIPATMYLYQDDNESVRVEVGQNFTPLTGTKSDLNSLVNGADISYLVDPISSFPAFENLALTYACLDLMVNPLSFSDILFSFTITAKPWSLFNDLIVIDQIAFSLQATNENDGWVASGNIYASAIFYPASNKNIVLSAYIALPSLLFTIKLDVQANPGKEIDLLAPVRNLVGDSIPMPVITGATFEVNGDIRNSVYSFSADIKETWELIGGANGLILTGMSLALATNITTGAIQGSVTGQFLLGGIAVSVSAVYDSQNGWTFTGRTAPGQIPSLTALLRNLGDYFGFKVPDGFPEMDLSNLSIEYAVKEQRIVVDAALSFAGASINLTDLPLVGKYLSEKDSIRLQSISLNIDTGGNSTLTIYLTLGQKAQTVTLSFGNAVTANDQSAYDAGYPLLASPDSAPGVDAGSQAGTWINIQQSFGPLSIQQIGFRLSDGGLEILFNAALSFSAFNASVLGLGVTIPLKSPYVPGFAIGGLGISYSCPSLRIDGAFLKTANTNYMEFAGELMVRFGNFGLTAIGAYATTDPASLFAFVMINAPIGGPPYFYVNGLSAGFGYNCNLLLPPIDKVTSFPLVAGAGSGGNPFGTHPTLAEAMKVMEQYLNVSIGENWLAAGVSVSSFGMVSVYALLSVAFGTRFQLGLLGLGTLQVPAKEPEPVIFAQLALEALFIPQDGLLAVYAELTPDSYILAKACRITGGFAFCLWFTPNEHAGDFVITFGGYNPYFKAPSYYPTVPRLGMNWAVSSELVIKGGMYFALTPHAVMAGGRLEATWKSGAISASFIAHADFLIYWKPFSYDIRLGVSFSVNASIDLAFVRISLSVSVGAELHIWGPDFHYRAVIDLDIISFTIGDEEGGGQPAGIDWPDFRDSFLDQEGGSMTPASVASSFMQRPVARQARDPFLLSGTALPVADSPCSKSVTSLSATDSPVVRAVITNGVLQDLTGTDASIDVHPDPANPSKTVKVPIDYIADPQHFSLRTQALVAGKTLSYNTLEGTGKWTSGGTDYTWLTDFGIGPMQLEAGELSSTHLVTICRLTDCMLYDGFTVTPFISRAPKAMWIFDKQLNTVLNNSALLDNVLQGLDIIPEVITPDHSLPILVAALETEIEGKVSVDRGVNTAPVKDPFGGLDPNSTFSATIAEDSVAQVRSDILTDLYVNGFSVTGALHTQPLQDAQTLQLLSPIILAYLGEPKHLS